MPVGHIGKDIKRAFGYVSDVQKIQAENISVVTVTDIEYVCVD